MNLVLLKTSLKSVTNNFCHDFLFCFAIGNIIIIIIIIIISVVFLNIISIFFFFFRIPALMQAAFSTSARRKGLAEFFDDKENWGEDAVKCGKVTFNWIS